MVFICLHYAEVFKTGLAFFLGQMLFLAPSQERFAQKTNRIRTYTPAWRAALLGGGLGEGLPSPRKSISLKKSPSVPNAPLSYDRVI